MKKPVNVLVVLTCVFAAFLGGFHIGRRMNRSPVHIYQVIPASEPEDEANSGQEDAAEAETPAAETVPAAIWPLNINTATAEQFDQLPGIGPVLAQRMVDYRQANGGYRAVEELLKVNGIGDAKLTEILDLITVDAGGNK